MKPASLLLPTAFSVLLSLGVSAAPSVTGTPAIQEDLQLARDMQFARELATRYAYVDYAEEVLEELGKKSLESGSKEALELLRCDVFAAGASGASTYEERTMLLEQALASYKKFIKDNGRSAQLNRAERSYLSLVNVYGRLLETRIGEELPDVAAELQQKLVAELEVGLEMTSELMSDTENPSSQSERNERFQLMIDRAQMYLTVGSAAEDGSYELERAYATAEQLAGEAGELSGFGLSAFLMLTKITSAQGLYDDASAFSEFVLDAVLPSPDNKANAGWDLLSREEQVQRWRLGELAAKGLVDAYLVLEDVETASYWSLYFFNYLKSEGFPLSDSGNAALLSVASALLESDGYVGGAINSGELTWYATEGEMSSAGHKAARNKRSALDLALSIAQDVNNAYKGKRSRLQVDAQKVISNIISRPGVSVSPEILLQAAEGDYNNKDYALAVQSLKSILAELATRDEVTRRQYTPHALYFLGLSYSRMGRHLEAAMAFREGPASWQGDADFGADLASKYNKAISRVAKASGNDPLLMKMVAEAEAFVIRDGKDTGSVSFTQAERKFGAKDYAGARAQYLQVKQGEPVYEKALMKAALCLYYKNDLVNARVEFKRYLEQYISDPRNKPVDRNSKAVRAQSTSLATYYLGTMAFSANGHEEALKYLADYHTKFEAQESYCELALGKVIQSHLALQDLASAKQAFAAQQERFPSSVQTGASAGRIYNAVNSMLAEAKKGGDEALAKTLTRELATYRGIANDLASNPSYTNLRTESKLWAALEEWERMERALRKLVKHFENDADPKKDIKKRVLPDLGLALLKQKRLPEAYQVLDPLIDKDPESKAALSSALSHRWATAVCGWLEGDEQNIIEVPGTGGAADLEVATRLLAKLTSAQGGSKYEAPWYQLKFDTAYAYYVWSKEDSSKKDTTKSLIENLKQRVGDDRLKDITEKTGDDVLRSRFLWLSGKVR